MLADAGGFKIEPIHYRSTGDAVTAIIAGQVQGAFVTTAMAAPQLASGKMRALAITGAERTKMLGDIATFNELRSEEHTSELQSLMRNSYAVFCLKKKKHQQQ